VELISLERDSDNLLLRPTSLRKSLSTKFVLFSKLDRLIAGVDDVKSLGVPFHLILRVN